MRIGIFTNNYLPNPYGVTSSIESFREEFEKMGHQVYIFAPKWKGYQDKNSNIFRYPSIDIKIKIRFPLAIPYSRKMDKILKNLDLDIIHAQHPNLLGTVAKKWAHKKNIPLVFTWHTLYDRYTNYVPFIPKKIVSAWIIKKASQYANQADGIVAPTDSIVPILRKWGVESEIRAIPTGVTEKFFQNPQSQLVKGKLGIKEDELVLCLVSRLTEEKNIDFIFQAIIPILKKNSKIKFLIAGNGYLLPKLKQYGVKEKLEKQIIFSGVVAKKDLKNYYQAGDIFLCASQTETQGMIISEAMYMGLPIVAVKSTGINSLVLNQGNGLLVQENQGEFQRAVEKLIKDSELRRKFSQVSRQIAMEHFTGQESALKMFQFYKELIQHKKKLNKNK